MLAEQVPHAEIDLIDVIFGHIKEAADGLCRFVAECDAQVDANNEIVN
jgi:hypothetical protein